MEINEGEKSNDEKLEKIIQELETIPKIIEQETPVKNDLSEVLFNKINSSKFRRTALDEESRADIKKKIENAVAANLPIEFSVPFGCYKSYLLPTYPEADWAEVFNLRYLISYLLPIAQIYKPGVILSYSKTQLVNSINNVPIKFYNSYTKSFSEIIAFFNKQCPKNLIIGLQEINDLYDNENEWKQELATLYEKCKINWNSYDQSAQEKKLASAKHNFIIKGEKDFSDTSPEELEKEYINAAIMVDTIENFSHRRAFNKMTHRIQIVFLRGPSNSIHLGSCGTSTVQFWVGFGAIEITEKALLPRILSFKQKEALAEFIERYPTTNAFCKVSKNFQTLPFIKK